MNSPPPRGHTQSTATNGIISSARKKNLKIGSTKSAHQANERKTTSRQERESHKLAINPTLGTATHGWEGTQNQELLLRSKGCDHNNEHPNC